MLDSKKAGFYWPIDENKKFIFFPEVHKIDRELRSIFSWLLGETLGFWLRSFLSCNTWREIETTIYVSALLKKALGKLAWRQDKKPKQEQEIAAEIGIDWLFLPANFCRVFHVNLDLFPLEMIQFEQ